MIAKLLTRRTEFEVCLIPSPGFSTVHTRDAQMSRIQYDAVIIDKLLFPGLEYLVHMEHSRTQGAFCKELCAKT